MNIHDSSHFFWGHTSGGFSAASLQTQAINGSPVIRYDSTRSTWTHWINLTHFFGKWIVHITEIKACWNATSHCARDSCNGTTSAGTTVFHSDAFSKSHSLPNMHGAVRYNNTATPLTQMHQGKWLCKWAECQRILQTAVDQLGKCVVFVASVMNLRYILTLY